MTLTCRRGPSCTKRATGGGSSIDAPADDPSCVCVCVCAEYPTLGSSRKTNLETVVEFIEQEINVPHLSVGPVGFPGGPPELGKLLGLNVLFARDRDVESLTFGS